VDSFNLTSGWKKFEDFFSNVWLGFTLLHSCPCIFKLMVGFCKGNIYLTNNYDFDIWWLYKSLQQLFFCSAALYGTNGVTPIKAELKLSSRSADKCMKEKYTLLCMIPGFFGIDSQHALDLVALLGVTISAVAWVRSFKTLVKCSWSRYVLTPAALNLQNIMCPLLYSSSVCHPMDTLLLSLSSWKRFPLVSVVKYNSGILKAVLTVCIYSICN